ncbi:MAG TPA: hypothetical protein VIY47_14760 [Ignavibacteriaceae bacterium]
MGTTFRAFVLEEEKIKKISVQKFENFFFQDGILEGFEGKEVIIAYVIIETEKRKPQKIMNMSAYRLRIQETGQVDKESLERACQAHQYCKNAMEIETKTDGNIVDASDIFIQKINKYFNPKISPKIQTLIREEVFGKNKNI